MDMKSLAGAIASFAPTVATMLGGPLVGEGVTLLESALGLAPGSGSDAITKVVTTGLSSDNIAAIRAADQAHAEKMRAADIDVLRINDDFAAHAVDSDVADRGSARLRESNVKDNTPKVLAYVITLGFFGIIGLVGYVPMQASAKDPILLLLGSLTTAWIAVVAYYFGSSSGAARGQELLAQSTPALAHAQPIEVTSK